MANITITNNSITATSNTVTINYRTDVTLSKVELTNDSSTWITAKTFSQTTATFDISSWDNGTYSNCKLRITYEIVTNYGEIVLSTSTISLNEGSTETFTVKLDAQPTNDQVVNLSVNNSNCSLNKSSLTFTPSNYSTTQSVTITGAHDTSSYSDKTSTITASSDGVTSKTINVTIKNTDTPPANTYTITRNLSNCACSNSANSVTQGSSYSATLSANSGYQLGKVTITMGGNDITNTAYSNGNISISNVTGNIVITANATAVETSSSYSITANLTHCKSSNAAKNISAGLGYVTNITADNGYTISSIIVTMGGTDVTSSVLKSGNQIYIPHVTGNIVITASAN